MVDKGLPGAALMLAMSMPTATAQNMSPIKFVVGFSAGGVTDTLARIVADDLHKQLNTVVLIEDGPKAAGIIVAEAVSGAARTILRFSASRGDGRAASLFRARLKFGCESVGADQDVDGWSVGLAGSTRRNGPSGRTISRRSGLGRNALSSAVPVWFAEA